MVHYYFTGVFSECFSSKCLFCYKYKIDFFMVNKKDTILLLNDFQKYLDQKLDF